MWEHYPERRPGSSSYSACRHLLHRAMWGCGDDHDALIERLTPLPWPDWKPRDSPPPDCRSLFPTLFQALQCVCMCVWLAAEAGVGQEGQQCHAPPRLIPSLLGLYSLRDLLAFQIPSWEMEMKAAFIKATAGSSSEGAGCGAWRGLSPQPPFLHPHVPPFPLFTETETNVFTVIIFTLRRSLLGVWLEHLRTATVTSPDPDSAGQAT